MRACCHLEMRIRWSPAVLLSVVACVAPPRLTARAADLLKRRARTRYAPSTLHVEGSCPNSHRMHSQIRRIDCELGTSVLDSPRCPQVHQNTATGRLSTRIERHLSPSTSSPLLICPPVDIHHCSHPTIAHTHYYLCGRFAEHLRGAGGVFGGQFRDFPPSCRCTDSFIAGRMVLYYEYG